MKGVINTERKFSYKTQGTCSTKIDIILEDDVIKHVRFHDGCDGNLKGVCSLVRDMPVKEAIVKLKDIKCGKKNTSCPDQLARALSAKPSSSP